MTDDDLSKLISRIYEAGLDSSLWSSTLHAIGDGLQSEGAALFPVPDPQAFRPVWSEGITPLADWALGSRDPIALNNPRAPRALAMRARTRVVTEADVCTPDELRHHPFNVAMRKLGFMWDVGSVFTEIAGTPLLFSAHRRVNDERFEAADKLRLAALLPHLARAVHIGTRIADARLAGMLEGFDRTLTGAVVIARGGGVVRMNAAADALAGSAFRLIGRRLVACDPTARVPLERLVESVAGPLALLHAIHAAVPLPRLDARPVAALAMPLQGDARDIFSNAAGLIVLIDPQARRPDGSEILQSLYRLTQAETRIALALARGRDLQEIADELGNSVATVRTQLKTVLAKTATNRQSQLIALISRLI